ncbi:SDR family oxidoreductase [Listeria innocua]|uniref:SDR family oxidoreductase n=1 Tax=Listeria innocua TaxID=1642 RepID=UPI00162A0E9C|nr:SDR family oxidoreductase [Listeria innocua]MBC2237145.1 SDR family oxidoreductase [Listeria innocua]
MTYLVTGATGGLGGYALNYLKELVPMTDIYALVRSEEKGADLKAAGFNIRIGDYSDAESMKQAFAGIDRVLFVSGAPGNRQVEHENVVNAAKEADVSYIAYTSFADADNSTSALAADHIFTEKVIEKSGIEHTFLRNNWYFENEMPMIGGALNGGKFVYAAGNGKTGWALKREYAEVAAKAVAGARFPEILELSGPVMTYAELTEALKEATGKEFEVISSDDKGFVENLVNVGMPQPVAEMFLSFQHDIKNNQLDVTSGDFEKALGKPLTNRVDALRELLQ